VAAGGWRHLRPAQVPRAPASRRTTAVLLRHHSECGFPINLAPRSSGESISARTVRAAAATMQVLVGSRAPK
jgi:hypothetical protein